MSGIRRAFFFASLERYICLVVSLATIAIVSRLLTPIEVGASAIGTALMTIAISLREFAGSGFLIQNTEVSREDVRTAFTLQLVLTLPIAAAVVLVAPRFAGLYREPMLVDFVRVTATTLILDTFASPITSLLRRDLAFGTLAIINVATLCFSALVTVGLAASGFSFMSVAWAWLAATLTTMTLSIAYRPDLGIFRPSLEAWRRALAFGGYHGAITVLNRLYEGLPQLVLGRFLPLGMVGFYNRAIMISSLADKLILAGVFNVAFPALAAEARAGRNLKQSLLKAFCYITVFYWPALVLMGLLAHPLVRLVLGAQWDAVVPLVQMMTVATLVWFPVVLAQPLLLAVGAMRHAFLSNLIALPLSALVLCAASSFGVEATAASQLVTSPFQMYVVLRFVRRHVPFTWTEFAVALRPSAVVSICSILPLLPVIGLTGFDLHLSVPLAVVAGGLSVCGWVVGIRLTGHPIGAEIHRAAEILGRHTATARLVGRVLAVETG